MVFGQSRTVFKQDDEETQRPPQSEKSNNSEEFIKTPEAQAFISKWMDKTKEWKQPYRKRGIVDLLDILFRVPGMTNKQILKTAERLLLKLGGMDGLQGFFSGMKAAPEGIIKGLKQALGK